PPEDGFVPQLERWLAAEGVEAPVANAGVSGDTTAGGRARLAWSVGEGADALVVVLGGNDLLRGIDPAVSRENLSALVAEARAMGMPVLLGGMRAPGNYGADYKTAFDAIYPEIAEAQGALLYPEFLAGVTDDPRLWQPDGLHPNAAGVEVIVEGMGPLVLELIGTP
ncbi:MAG: arylesterase, partial [Pseudomonadota bacterium]